MSLLCGAVLSGVPFLLFELMRLLLRACKPDKSIKHIIGQPTSVSAVLYRAVLCRAVPCCAVLRARREAVRVKEREAAQQLLQAHDPVKAAATRHGWLMFTVPEKPVAGEAVSQAVAGVLVAVAGGSCGCSSQCRRSLWQVRRIGRL
jgi:hypothetical protein